MRSPEYRYLFGKLVDRKRLKLGWDNTKTAEEVYNDPSRGGDVTKVRNGELPLGPSTEGKFRTALDITDEEIEHISSRRFERPPHDTFPFKKFGNIELPVCHLFGLPSDPYKLEDVEYRDRDELAHSSSDFPHYLKEQLPVLIERYRSKHDPNRTNTNNVLLRLDRYTAKGEDQEDNRGNLVLFTSRTNWFAYCATNRQLFEPAKDIEGNEKTVREVFGEEPLDLAKSFLGNTLSVHTALISSSPNQVPEKQLILLKRNAKSGIYPGAFQSAAGYVNISHRDKNGMASPFVTSCKETIAELGEDLDNDPGRVNITGLCISWEDLDLNFCAVYETHFTSAEVLSMFVRDDFEGKRAAIPWELDAVVEHILENHWEPVGAYNVILALISYFGKSAVDKACSKRRKPELEKRWVDFLEHL